MVIAIASLLGGQWTLIGTRSNVLVSDFLRSRTGEGLHFLSFTPIAVAIWAAFTLFFVTIGRRLLPTRGDEQSLADRYEVKEYLTEVLIAPTAELAGKRLEDLDLPGEGVTILGVVRGERHLPPSPWIEIHSGDVLIVQGLISGITSLLARPGFEERTELKLRDQTLRSVDLRMVEAVVAPNSGLEGHSLDELDFHDRYRLSVLGIGRGGRPLAGRPTAQELRFGDSLLLVGHEEMIRRLRGDESLILMESRALPARSRRRAVFLLVVFAAVVVLASTRVLEPALALVVGAMAAVLGRCIGMREAYQAVDWRTIVVLGSMIPYGLALEETGTAELLARGTVRLLGDHGPHAIFAALLLLVVLATQVIENAAVAVILAPVAYELARAAGADPVPYLLGTAICTSAGFTNPMAHESTLLVFAPGGYRFRDYLVLGIPAALITWVVSVLLVPLLHPLTP
jgi:di/tricarboxylate transporter